MDMFSMNDLSPILVIPHVILAIISRTGPMTPEEGKRLQDLLGTHGLTRNEIMERDVLVVLKNGMEREEIARYETPCQKYRR